MSITYPPIDHHRYKHKDGYLIIEIAVNNSKQLFNQQDPSPFRERDLDDDFVTYAVSSVQEFSLKTKIKIQIVMIEENDINEEQIKTIQEAIRTYFEYEAKLTNSKLKTRLRTARFFSLIGFTTLFACLSISQFISSLHQTSTFVNIISTGFVIIGWVALWHPIEALLYDWWPIREQRLYYEKISQTPVEVRVLTPHSPLNDL